MNLDIRRLVDADEPASAVPRTEIGKLKRDNDMPMSTSPIASS